MNEWMEKQLSGWTPRRPSERIERDLFERPPVAPPKGLSVDESLRHGLMRWMGPAGAMAMVLVVMITHTPLAAGRTMAVADTGAHSFVPCAAGSLPEFYHHSVLNHCDYPIFGWTNSALPAEGIAHFRK